jgi:hypothetical protein
VDLSEAFAAESRPMTAGLGGVEREGYPWAKPRDPLAF